MIVWSPSKKGTYHAHMHATEGTRSVCGHAWLRLPRGVQTADKMTPAQLARRCGTCLRTLAAWEYEEVLA